jgi:hypothetical protein
VRKKLAPVQVRWAPRALLHEIAPPPVLIARPLVAV